MFHGRYLVLCFLAAVGVEMLDECLWSAGLFHAKGSIPDRNQFMVFIFLIRKRLEKSESFLWKSRRIRMQERPFFSNQNLYLLPSCHKGKLLVTSLHFECCE